MKDVVWNSLRIAGESIRANVAAIIVLWLLALTLVVSYFAFPLVPRLLSPLVEFQRQGGCLAAAMNRIVFSAVLPFVLQILIAAIRPRRPVLVLSAQIVWCAIWGMLVDVFYTVLDLWFGSATDPGTLLLKTGLNQFVWTALVIAPANACFYFWIARDFSLRRTRLEWPAGTWSNVVLPNLISNWCVWIPVNLVIFIFPLPLQIQLSGLVGAFWTLLCLQIGARSR